MKLLDILKAGSLPQGIHVIVMFVVSIFLTYLSATILNNLNLSRTTRILGIVATTMFIILIEWAIIDTIGNKNLIDINDNYGDDGDEKVATGLDELTEIVNHNADVVKQDKKNLGKVLEAMIKSNEAFENEVHILKKQIKDLQDKLKN